MQGPDYTTDLMSNRNFCLEKVYKRINTGTIYGLTLIYLSNIVICLVTFILFVPNEKHVIEEGTGTISSKRGKNQQKKGKLW